uniref:Uncharacterized protein n=1 Tax=Tanacetum cinerariifolium TaxID=118510 RepID=A0A6L2K4F9_TANCI|nr:hypothetical protein [Tanacetum cinerariifolium]
MEAGTTTTLTAKLPIINPGEYDLWLIRIEQLFLMTDYSLWEVIKNGNKVLKKTVRTDEQIYKPTFAEEKLDRKNEMKARGTLLMALPNNDQLKFHSYQDAKLLMEAIEKRYGGNKESKKVQRTLLKKQYENFIASILETLDQTFDRLQKLISQLEIQGEVIEQEDMNLKLLKSIPSEWKTHALIWRNKADIKTISLDDLYNNLKIYEPELTRSSNTSQNLQNVAFVSSNSISSTNEADNTAYAVSTAPTQGNIVNFASVDNLSYVVICVFLTSQSNSPQLAKEDIKQIDPDNLQEIDLHWEIVTLTIRARRECKAPKNQENKGREYGRKTMPVENLTKNALIAQDGIGGSDWSYQAEEELPINYALMALTSSGSSSSFDSKSVEERLAHYKKNEVVFEEKINISDIEVKLKDNALVANKKKLKKVKKERGYKADSSAVESFVNSSEILENHENVKSISDKGYHAVLPPYTGNYIPPKPNLVFIDEQVESVCGCNPQQKEYKEKGWEMLFGNETVHKKREDKMERAPTTASSLEAEQDSEACCCIIIEESVNVVSVGIKSLQGVIVVQSMRMEQYLTHTNYALWEVIINGDSPVLEPPAVAIPDEHLLKFHSIKDAKSLWEAIKIIFGGNKESKKMHKTIQKQQYENIIASRYEGLDKTYDRFQKHISQLELNGKVISPKDANIKLLRRLPPAWNNIALIMRNKPDIETLSMDDLYNNLKVYEAEIKGQSSSGSKSHNVVFVSFENTSSINETVTAAHDISTTGKNLNYNGKKPVGFDMTKVECYNWHRRGHFARECHVPKNRGNKSVDNEKRVVPVETPASALVVQDRLGGYDWSYQFEEGPTDFALMDYSSDSANSSNSELEETMKEKDDLKEKLTKFEESSKNLTKLINSQMSANDKSGLGYDSQLSKNEMPKCEIFDTASDSSVSEIDEDNNQAKDRYKVGIKYHAVSPPYTGNYMPPRADISFAGLDDSVFKFKISETRTSVNENESIASKSSTGQREVRPVWNNARRVNHQNLSKVTHPHLKRNFVPTAVATKSRQVLINVAKQNSAASTSTTRPKVNTAAIRPNVNAKSSYFKPHFPKRSHFNQRSAEKTNRFSRNINTTKGKNVTTVRPKAVVNVVKGKKKTVVKSSTGCVWRPMITNLNNVSKDSSGSWI